jgi:WD40 repeat protein
MGLPGGFGVAKKNPMKLHKSAVVATLETHTVTTKELNNKNNNTITQNTKTTLLTNQNNTQNTKTTLLTYKDDPSVEKELLPISAITKLHDHTRAVSAMCFDPSQSRFLTAGRDYLVKFWDFHSMSHFMRPFHSFEPAEGNPIRDIAFNLSGGLFLVAPNTAKAKLFSRDGEEMAEYIQGDPYC